MSKEALLSSNHVDIFGNLFYTGFAYAEAPLRTPKEQAGRPKWLFCNVITFKNSALAVRKFTVIKNKGQSSGIGF
jgi:hypothetical protein